MKKKFKGGIIIIFLMLPVIAMAHFIVYPQETRCMLIRFSGFQRQENIYFRPGINTDTLQLLEKIQSAAERKNNIFWGEDYKSDHKLIYCSTEKDYADYGSRGGAPAVTHRKCGASVVLSIDGLDTSIAAHELSHCILYNNIGWYKTTFKIPVWFDEGLAMQVDERANYSVDSITARKNRGVIISNVAELSAVDFFSGDTEAVMLRFSTAKYIVYEWLKKHSLQKFISRINKGVNFTVAYTEPD